MVVYCFATGVAIGVLSVLWWRERYRRKAADARLHEANALALKAAALAEEAHVEARVLYMQAGTMQMKGAMASAEEMLLILEQKRRVATTLQDMREAVEEAEEVATLPWHFEQAAPSPARAEDEDG